MQAFKVCSMCHTRWPVFGDFQDDPRLKPVGLVVDFDDPWQTLLLFNHDCGTTLAVCAESCREALAALGDDPLLAGLPGCPGFCRDFLDLHECGQRCRNASLRQFVARATAGLPLGC